MPGHWIKLYGILFSGDKYIIAPGVGIDSGFDGCIRKLKIGNHHSKEIDFAKDVLEASNVKECTLIKKGCANYPCINGGECKPLTNNDYECICEDQLR